MPATQLVILLSLGSFQAAIPELGAQPSPVFADTKEGLTSFTRWAKGTLPTPKFNQAPLAVCVVGAVPFTPEKAPYLPRPLWESQWPVRALEPYSATFHYVEVPPGAPPPQPLKPPKPRTLKQALKLCADAARK